MIDFENMVLLELIKSLKSCDSTDNISAIEFCENVTNNDISIPDIDECKKIIYNNGVIESINKVLEYEKEAYGKLTTDVLNAEDLYKALFLCEAVSIFNTLSMARKDLCEPLTLMLNIHEKSSVAGVFEYWYLMAASPRERMLYLWDTTLHYMDEEICEQIHAETSPCSHEEFLTRYEELHLKKYGEEFEIN